MKLTGLNPPSSCRGENTVVSEVGLGCSHRQRGYISTSSNAVGYPKTKASSARNSPPATIPMNFLNALDSNSPLAIQLFGIPLMARLLAILQALALVILE